MSAPLRKEDLIVEDLIVEDLIFEDLIVEDLIVGLPQVVAYCICWPLSDQRAHSTVAPTKAAWLLRGVPAGTQYRGTHKSCMVAKGCVVADTPGAGGGAGGQGCTSEHTVQ